MIDKNLAKRIYDLGLKINTEVYHTNDEVFPLPTAEDLMEIIPGKIIQDTKAYYLRIHKEEFNYHAVYFRIQYIDDKTITYLMHDSVLDSVFVNALAKLVIWLLEHKYIPAHPREIHFGEIYAKK